MDQRVTSEVGAETSKSPTETPPTGRGLCHLRGPIEDVRVFLGESLEGDFGHVGVELTGTALLAGLRADELLRANVGDLRRSDDGAVIHVRGKGGKDRRIPIEPVMVEVLERYLDSRAARLPTTTRRRSPGGGLAAWTPAAPLFVGGDGERISRVTLQSRVLRAFRRAGIDADRARGALVHGLRHTFVICTACDSMRYVGSAA
jgi:integrase